MNVFGYTCVCSVCGCVYVCVYCGAQIACAHYTCAQCVHVVCMYVCLVCVVRRVHMWLGPRDPLVNATQHCVGTGLHSLGRGASLAF